jgi:predicted dehydrogenase
MLADRDVDIVAVVTSCDQHTDMSIAALEAGKHVMCEIPVAGGGPGVDRRIERCFDLIRTVEGSGKKFQSGNFMRWNPREIAIRDAVQGGKLGVIFHAESEYLHDVRGLMRIDDDGQPTFRNGFGQVPQETISAGGGLHATDTIRWILGEQFVEVQGYGNRFCTPFRRCNDFEIALFKTESGAIVKVTCAKALTRGYVPEYRGVYGTEGSIETGRVGDLDVIYHWASSHDKPKPLPVGKSKVDEMSPEIREKVGHGGYHFLQDKELVDAILNDAQPSYTVYEGVQSCIATLCALKSIQNGGDRVAIPQFYDCLNDPKGYFRKVTYAAK